MKNKKNAKINAEIKICSACNKRKPLTTKYFHRSNKTTDGFLHICILCRAKAGRKELTKAEKQLHESYQPKTDDNQPDLFTEFDTTFPRCCNNPTPEQLHNYIQAVRKWDIEHYGPEHIVWHRDTWWHKNLVLNHTGKPLQYSIQYGEMSEDSTYLWEYVSARPELIKRLTTFNRVKAFEEKVNHWRWTSGIVPPEMEDEVLQPYRES